MFSGRIVLRYHPFRVVAPRWRQHVPAGEKWCAVEGSAHLPAACAEEPALLPMGGRFPARCISDAGGELNCGGSPVDAPSLIGLGGRVSERGAVMGVGGRVSEREGEVLLLAFWFASCARAHNTRGT